MSKENPSSWWKSEGHAVIFGNRWLFGIPFAVELTVTYNLGTMSGLSCAVHGEMAATVLLT
jgi:hypothetical protein